MVPDKRSGIGDLEIDLIRRPFESVVPTKVVGESARPTSIVTPGTMDVVDEIPGLRADMLRELFKIFPGREADVRERMLTHMKGGFSPVDAIFVGIVSVLDDSLQDASEFSPEFIRARTLYDLMHMGKVYRRGGKNALEELRNFSGHGTAVLMGLLEDVPTVYEAAYGRKPNRSTLKELIPSCADRMLSSLSRVNAGYANDVETLVFGQPKFLGYKEKSYKRVTIDPSRLAMRDVGGKNILDVTASVTRDVRHNVSVGQIKYHGCLAGLVKAKQPDMSVGQSPTVFTYIKNLSAELMLEHAFPDIRD